MKGIVLQAAEHLIIARDDEAGTIKLPYIWAYGLCMAGRRLEFMQWLHQLCSSLNLVIDSIWDGDDGSVLFNAIPIEEAKSN